MDENQTPEDSFTEEFQNLGKNLVSLIQTAWDRPERKRIQQEIETGLNNLGKTVKIEADAFSESPTGKRFRTDMQDLEAHVRNSETQAKIREEILSVLHNANAELQKVAQKWSRSQETVEQETADEPEQPDNNE